MYRKKISIAMLVVLLLGLTLVIKRLITSEQETENNLNIFYALNNNNNFYWIVKDGKKIFDIKPSDNSYIENFNGDVKKYLDIEKNEYNYTQYKNESNVVKENFKVVSISENPRETNYIQNHKMIYDLSIDFTGKAIANVYYPDEKKGGYIFTLSKDEFNFLKRIVNKSSSVGQKYFINNNYCGQAIVINDKYVLNDYSKMKSDLDTQAIIMFSNLLTIKYIAEHKATNNTYKIKSSEYTKMYKPEPL